MFQLTRRISFGVDIGNLFQLQCAFKGDWEVDTATKKSALVFLANFLRPSGDLWLKVENVLNAARQLTQFFNVFTRLFIGNQTTLFAQGNGQAEQDNQLGRECFGRGNADFCAGACVQYQFAFTRQGGFHHVTNRQAVFVSQGLRVF